MTVTAAPVVVARGLRKSYGDLTVLDGVDLDVASGEVLALLGPNGAGKTTTVRILATLLRPDGGTAYVAGKNVVTQAADVRAAISLTGQFAAVDELLTGVENLRLMARLAHLGRREVRTRSDELLELFDLTDAGRPRGQDLLRRHATSARPGRRAAGQAAGRVPRRTDHRARSPEPERAVGRHPGRRRARHDGAAHHAVPGGGRPAGRPDRGHRPRSRHRERDGAGAEGAGRVRPRVVRARGRGARARRHRRVRARCPPDPRRRRAPRRRRRVVGGALPHARRRLPHPDRPSDRAGQPASPTSPCRSATSKESR